MINAQELSKASWMLTEKYTGSVEFFGKMKLKDALDMQECWGVTFPVGTEVEIASLKSCRKAWPGKPWRTNVDHRYIAILIPTESGYLGPTVVNRSRLSEVPGTHGSRIGVLV